MRDCKSIIVRQCGAFAALLAVGLIFLGLPWLADVRAALASKIGFPEPALWFAVAAILLGTLGLLAKSLIATIAKPIQLLAFDADKDQLNYAIERKSRTREEDSLKLNIESRLLRQREASSRIDELETELERVTEKFERHKETAENAGRQIEVLEAEQKKFRIENETLKSAKLAIEITLENERQSKVGREVEKRADEIYDQLERAVAAESFRSVWVPNLLAELREPIIRIQDVATGLRDTWTDNSIALIERSIIDICGLAETQIAALDALGARSFERPALQPAAQPASVPAIPETPTAEEQASPSDEPISLDLGHDESTPISNHDLRTLLGALIDEFAIKDTDARFELAVNPDLDVQIDDESFEQLLRTLLDLSISIIDQGTIALGVSLEPNRLEFDVACNGELEDADAIDLSKANRWARQLSSEVSCEAPSQNELHFSFNYSFD